MTDLILNLHIFDLLAVQKGKIWILFDLMSMFDIVILIVKSWRIERVG